MHKDVYVCIYMYEYICVCMCVCIYIYERIKTILPLRNLYMEDKEMIK